MGPIKDVRLLLWLRLNQGESVPIFLIQLSRPLGYPVLPMKYIVAKIRQYPLWTVLFPSGQGFLRMILVWNGSVFKLIWFHILLFSLAYALISILYRTVFIHNAKQKEIFEVICIYCSRQGIVLALIVVMPMFQWTSAYLLANLMFSYRLGLVEIWNIETLECLSLKQIGTKRISI